MKAPWTETGSPWGLALLRIVLALVVWAESYATWRPPHHVDEPIVMVLGVVLTLSSTAMLVGWRSQWAAGVTGVAMLVLHGAGVAWGLGGGGLPFATVSTFELALSCVLLALGPCGARASVDAWRGAAPRTVPLWSLGLLRVHASITLLFVFVSHLDGRWLRGEALAQMLTARRQVWVEAGLLEQGLAWAWVGLEALAVAAPWVTGRGGRPLVGVAVGFLLLQYPALYTGTWSVHLAALVWLTARSGLQPHQSTGSPGANGTM